jgi:hypothetical protein
MIGYGNSVFLRRAYSTGLPPVNTVAPSITGTAQEGQTVTCSTGTWTGTPTITYAYQWRRNGSNIGSATNSTYTLVTADVSQSITCQVTATNGSGSASATSNTITPIAAVDPDAQAFITAAAITDPTQQAAINTLVVDLKGYNVWTKMKALYPFVGSTASQQKFNLKDPRDLDAAFRLQFLGGWTHSVNGALPNGTNAYANTFLIPSFSLTFSSGHYSLYIRSNINESKYDMAVVNISWGAEHSIVSRWNNIFYHSYGLASTYPQIANTDSRGHFITNRNSATNTTGFKNGVNVTNTIQPAVTPPNNNIYIGARYAGAASEFSSKQFAFSSIGDGLTDAEAGNFYTAVQAFQTTLGRQV